GFVIVSTFLHWLAEQTGAIENLTSRKAQGRDRFAEKQTASVSVHLLTKMSAKTAVGKSFDSRILSPPKKGAQDAIGVLVRHKGALSTTPLWLIEAPLKNICSA